MSEQRDPEHIRLLLLDHQALFRTSLSRLLRLQPGFEVAGECGLASEALEILAASAVDVVLLDSEHATEGQGGFMAPASKSGYQGRFLIVTSTADAHDAALAIRLGASGIFLKSEPPDRLIQAIQLVAHGAVWFDQRIIRSLADERKDSGITDRERKVLMGILNGLTNRKIGSSLGVSEGAVKSAVQQLFLKARVRTRSQLVRAALEGSFGASSAAQAARNTSA